MIFDRRVFAWGVAIFALSLHAHAQPAAPEQDAAFRNGLDQYTHGNNTGAIATWESLLTTMGEERGYKVLYNLARAYQAIGDITHAIERYRAFVKQVGARTDVPKELAERAADAQSRVEQLERSYGAIRMNAPTHGGLVLTRVGSSEPRAAGYVVWLAPGRHDLELFVGTDHVKKLTVEVVPGKTLDIDTSPPEEPPSPAPVVNPPPPAQTKSAEPPPPQSNRWVWIGAAATAVSIAAPVITYVVASQKKDDATALGRGSDGYPAARDSFDSWKTINYVSYALPAVLALATIGYVVFRPSPKSVALLPAGLRF
jgi:hypothetical protein